MCYKIRGCIALLLFPQDKLTLGQASVFAQMSQLEFQRLLANRQIPVHLDTLRKLGHKSIMTVGRISRNDVQVPLPRVSRLQAKIRWENSTWVLEDAESLNGVVYQGERVERVLLRDGDRVYLAPTVVLEYKETSA